MSDVIEIKNATVSSMQITNADHGWLSIWLHLDYGGSGQGFGGYALSNEKSYLENGDYTGRWIWQILKVTGTSNWDEVLGKNIRVKKTGGWNGQITAIGHITKDIWFDPKKEFEEINTYERTKSAGSSDSK